MTEWGKLIRVLHHRRRNRQIWYGGPSGLFTLKKQNGSFQLKKFLHFLSFACLTSMTALSGLETVKMEYTR